MAHKKKVKDHSRIGDLVQNLSGCYETEMLFMAEQCYLGDSGRQTELYSQYEFSLRFKSSKRERVRRFEWFIRAGQIRTKDTIVMSIGKFIEWRKVCRENMTIKLQTESQYILCIQYSKQFLKNIIFIIFPGQNY